MERDLKEVGLFQMPYDRDVYIQASARECVGADAGAHHHMIYGPFGTNQIVGISLYDAKLGITTASEVFDDRDAIDCLRSLLIILLATKNAEKRTTENKLAKLGIGKSAKHRFAYTTTIGLPRYLPDDVDNPPRGGHIAPHLRRGHIRRQHYGANNQFEKQIWIAPVFVNADPDFVAARRRYRIGGAVKKAA